MSDKDNKHDTCPICSRDFPLKELQNHANICLFLHAAQESSHDDKPPKKRPRSPEPLSSNKSPRNTNNLTSKGISPSSQKSLHPFFSQVARPSTSTEKSPHLTQNNHEFHKPQTSTKTKEDPMAFLTPLAKQVAPKSFQHFFGQNHVLGENTVLRSLIDKGEVPNMILWGPPGCGKTSLAGVVQEKCKSNPALYKFHSLCAATCGVKEVSTIVANAKNERKFGRRTVLFMDEIHRFNKKQQDVFLLHVERGDIVLIGATTENPSFVMNSALLSRCRVIVMEKLDPGDVLRIVVKAAKSLRVKVLKDKETSDENEENKETSENEDSENDESENEEESDDSSLIESLGIEKSALKWLADTSDGDARIALGNLQLVLQHNKNHEGLITFDDIKEGVKKSHLLYDRQGEEHYNIISAMHKSIRGSDVNASLYWTTRMIVSGEDPRFIARRLVRAASEDIGNADPNALQLAISTMQGCQLLGMPEADVLLAQCAIYLARAPKSREADSALAAAKKTISNCEGLQPSVPLHLRNAPTKLMKDLGYGKQDANTSSSFMPPGMENVNFFQ